ncbi:MAG: hypothetical protein ACTSVO_01235 [Candidatus Heimdallarchaeaceae archaeon]
MDNIKLSLVSKSGILLGSKPESVDDTQQILASGLISAIITYAQEIHHRELQSITYYDRTISFVQFQEFILIVETLDKDFTFSERQSKQLLEQIYLSMFSLLDGRDSELLTEGEAQLIIEHCFHDISSLNIILTRFPLKNLVPEIFTIQHKVKGVEILENRADSAYHKSIAQIIDNNIINVNQKIKAHSFLTLIPEHKKTFYVIFSTDGFTTKVGYFIIPQELDHTVFRVYPMLERLIKSYTGSRQTFDFIDLLVEMQEFEDSGNKFSLIDLDEISLSTLSNTTNKNLDTVLFAAISGKPIYVVGDKSVSKLIVDTLSIFTQHLHLNVADWITEDDLSKVDFNILLRGIVGMSSSTYQSILPLIHDKEALTVINLEEDKITGPSASSYFIQFFENIKDEDPTKTSIILFHELKKLVSLAYIITSVVSKNEEDSQIFLKGLNTQFPYPASFIEKSKNLAKQRNMFLDYVL